MKDFIQSEKDRFEAKCNNSFSQPFHQHYIKCLDPISEGHCQSRFFHLITIPSVSSNQTVSVRCPPLRHIASSLTWTNDSLSYIYEMHRNGKLNKNHQLELECRHQKFYYKNKRLSSQNNTNLFIDCFHEIGKLRRTHKLLALIVCCTDAISIMLLVVSIVTLAYFKNLHCTRNYIHIHAFISFVLYGLFRLTHDFHLIYTVDQVDRLYIVLRINQVIFTMGV